MNLSDKPEPQYYKWGIFYYNPDDPDLLAKKRTGWGLTINFAHRKGWYLLIFPLFFPLMCLLLPLLLQK